MDAPEKLYFPPDDALETYARNDSEEEIKYVRADAFIEKACKWIEEFNNHHHILRYSDSCEPPLSEFTEWFKNYMKGE